MESSTAQVRLNGALPPEVEHVLRVVRMSDTPELLVELRDETGTKFFQAPVRLVVVERDDDTGLPALIASCSVVAIAGVAVKRRKPDRFEGVQRGGVGLTLAEVAERNRSICTRILENGEPKTRVARSVGLSIGSINRVLRHHGSTWNAADKSAKRGKR